MYLLAAGVSIGINMLILCMLCSEHPEVFVYITGAISISILLNCFLQIFLLWQIIETYFKLLIAAQNLNSTY